MALYNVPVLQQHVNDLGNKGPWLGLQLLSEDLERSLRSEKKLAPEKYFFSREDFIF